ncbi:MAG: DNA mismatch repair protein MutS [Acidobacteriia bacterium]|nr:DNA mismatch repair protein MutS [Terriglobia bacterium]
MDNLTPMMRQYSQIKQAHPNALLLFRLGDFYELFFEDAIIAARELQIVLTSRNREKGVQVPMCGVPYHAADNYIAKLIHKGYRVAICDQTEDPKLAKKLVRREVTRVITPGTVVDSSLLEPSQNNYLCSLCCGDRIVGLACADLSTGEFKITQLSGEAWEQQLTDELEGLSPSEALYPASAAASLEPLLRLDRAHPASTPLDDWIFSAEYAERVLTQHFGVMTLAGFGCETFPYAIRAAGAVIHYLRETQRAALSHLVSLSNYNPAEFLVLDQITQRNLELVDPQFPENKDATLLRTLDGTSTPMGARLLRNWILRPLRDLGAIRGRLQAVEQFKHSTINREEIRNDLKTICDLERVLSRIALGTVMPRELIALKNSLFHLPVIKTFISNYGSPLVREIHGRIDPLEDIRALIESQIKPDPPPILSEGGIIQDGVDEELDSLRHISVNGKTYIAQLEARERERSHIGSLKVKYNQIFGYYIEVSRANRDLVPSDYERKQTLVNAERFTTPELKEYEVKVLSAEERICELEKSLYEKIRTQIAAEAKRIRETAQALAELDVLVCFAHLANEYRYVPPAFSEEGELLVVAGRHPVIERLCEKQRLGEFIPNDLYLNSSTDQIIILTGPNMGGKSTYLRQAALLVVMAQMGSFVPAEKALLPLVDRIFTRIGASDNLARGRSTFMVEMTETAAILHSATPQSLIILDEVGRGTATFDGLSIAWATVEHLHQKLKSKTLFATHYHELTELGSLFPGVKNYHVSVRESGHRIVFLRKVEAGPADKSYGIEVARLAGLPLPVVERARAILHRHERREQDVSDDLLSQSLGAAGNKRMTQIPLFEFSGNGVLEALREVKPDELTPIEALNLLNELVRKVRP